MLLLIGNFARRCFVILLNLGMELIIATPLVKGKMPHIFIEPFEYVTLAGPSRWVRTVFHAR
jgi:hypothetical protein